MTIDQILEAEQSGVTYGTGPMHGALHQLAVEVRELRAMLYRAALDKTADDAEISRLRKQLKERP